MRSRQTPCVANLNKLNLPVGFIVSVMFFEVNALLVPVYREKIVHVRLVLYV